MSLTVFDPIKAILVELVKKDQSLVFDHTTPEGEKDLRSWVKRLRNYKGDVARAHKEVKAEALSFGRQVDAIKNELTVNVDTLITERMRPLDEIEAKKRAVAEAIVKAEEDARIAKEAEELAELKRREAEVARKEAEIKEKERIEREKLIAAEAAENATKEAEAKAKAIEDARIVKEATEQAEKERLAKIEKARIENEQHRIQVESKACNQIRGIVDEYEQLEGYDTATAIVDALKQGKIDNVTINY